MFIGGASLILHGQEKSVKPGINDNFKDPDLPKYLKTFEGESREIYASRKEIVAACRIKEGMTVADVGAGTGLFTRLFAREVGDKGKVVAVDIAQKFLDHIMATCKEARIANVQPVLCKADSTELAVNSVDLVFTSDTYHHFEFPQRTLASIHKALKPGGQFIVVDFHRIPGKSSAFVLGHVRAPQEVVIAEVKLAGFKLVEEIKIAGLKENYFLRFEKIDKPQSNPVEPPVMKIWDKAPHNAFTDLIRYRERWFCTFREGDGHAAGAGKIRVIASADGDKWESTALLERPGEDYRDPKFCIAPDGRLMLTSAVAIPARRNPLTDHISVVSFSKDGKEWTPPTQVVNNWQWLWRVTWHNNIAYATAHTWDPKAPREDRKRSTMLVQSRDGETFEKITSFDMKNPSEATIRFDGDTMICLQRRDGVPNTAMLGTSKPPYKDWTWKDLGVYFGGPNLIQLPNKTWIAGGRLIQDGKPKTVLAKLDIAEGKLIQIATLPSGGDSSYPGFVWHDDQLWISYYSSHEGKSSIYLAKWKP